MKKQVQKLGLKTDRIINLSKADASQIQGGTPKERPTCKSFKGCNE